MSGLALSELSCAAAITGVDNIDLYWFHWGILKLISTWVINISPFFFFFSFFFFFPPQDTLPVEAGLGGDRKVVMGLACTFSSAVFRIREHLLVPIHSWVICFKSRCFVCRKERTVFRFSLSLCIIGTLFD